MSNMDETRSRIRSHTRRSCQLPATVRVAEDDASHVPLSSSALSPDGGVSATVFDVSEAGVGFRSTVFLPKGCRLRLEVASPVDGESAMYSGAAEVRRAVMCDSTPTYEIGVAFAAGEPEESGGASVSAETLMRWAEATSGEAAA